MGQTLTVAEDADARPARADFGVAVDRPDDLPRPVVDYPSQRVSAVVQVRPDDVSRGPEPDTLEGRTLDPKGGVRGMEGEL